MKRRKVTDIPFAFDGLGNQYTSIDGAVLATWFDLPETPPTDGRRCLPNAPIRCAVQRRQHPVCRPGLSGAAEECHDKLEYIHDNPIGAGLLARRVGRDGL